LDKWYSVIKVGLPYYSDIQTLDLDDPHGETYTDKRIGVKIITVKLDKTGALTAGPDFTENLPSTIKMDPIQLRSDEPQNMPTKLFTGIIRIPIETEYKYGGSYALRNDVPLPMTILSISPLIEVEK